MEESLNSMINRALVTIKKRAAEHPEDVETIITELKSLCNKMDPNIIFKKSHHTH